MTLDPQALVADILAAPDDDAPRLVFADWIADADPARAELIVVQCELAREPIDEKRRRALLRRESALLKKHEQRWARYLGDVVSSLSFRRGFVESVALSSWDAGAVAHVLDGAPVRSLTLFPRGETTESARALVAIPRLSAIRELRIGSYGGDPLDPAIAATLFGAPTLAGLESLALDECAVDRRIATSLASDCSFDRLRRLAISDDRLPIEAVSALAAARFAKSLRALALAIGGWTRAIADRAATIIAESPRLAALEELDLALSPVGDDGAIAIAGRMKRLVSLELVAGQITNKGARAIAESPLLSSLRSLRLRGNKITGAGAAALAASKTLRALEHLDLTNNAIDAKRQAELREAFGSRVEIE